MSWFNRNKNIYDNQTDDYLQTSDTVSRPLALVFVLLMVFVIAAVAFSLFLGGRWLYQNLDGKSTKDTEIITGQTISEDTNKTNNGQTTTSSSTNTNGQSNNSATTTQNSTTGTSTPSTSAATTAIQQVPTVIPNTGPEPE